MKSVNPHTRQKEKCTASPCKAILCEAPSLRTASIPERGEEEPRPPHAFDNEQLQRRTPDGVAELVYKAATAPPVTDERIISLPFNFSPQVEVLPAGFINSSRLRPSFTSRNGSTWCSVCLQRSTSARVLGTVLFPPAPVRSGRESLSGLPIIRWLAGISALALTRPKRRQCCFASRPVDNHRAHARSALR